MPFVNDVIIEKKACVGHVQKRLGSRMRKLKSSCVKRKLSDGKSIGGKGRLTDKIVDTMQNCYGLAIRQMMYKLVCIISPPQRITLNMIYAPRERNHGADGKEI